MKPGLRRRTPGSDCAMITPPPGNPARLVDCDGDGRSPGSRISPFACLPACPQTQVSQWHPHPWKDAARTYGNPLTVAGAATVLAPVGSSAPCSLLFPSGGGL